MPLAVLRAYAEALPDLVSEDQQRLIQASVFPHLKPGDQRRIIGSLGTGKASAGESADPRLAALAKLGMGDGTDRVTF